MSEKWTIVEVYECDGLMSIEAIDRDGWTRIRVIVKSGWSVEFGDVIRWDNDWAYWTPADGCRTERPIPKVVHAKTVTEHPR